MCIFSILYQMSFKNWNYGKNQNSKLMHCNIGFSFSDWEIGVVPGVGMAQGLMDNYLNNSFVSITGISAVDSKCSMTFYLICNLRSVHIERVTLRVSLRVTLRLDWYNAFLCSYSHCTAANIKGINHRHKTYLLNVNGPLEFLRINLYDLAITCLLLKICYQIAEVTVNFFIYLAPLDYVAADVQGSISGPTLSIDVSYRVSVIALLLQNKTKPVLSSIKLTLRFQINVHKQ